jgi:hypothetical protein
MSSRRRTLCAEFLALKGRNSLFVSKLLGSQPVKTTTSFRLIVSFAFTFSLASRLASGVHAAPWDPGSADYSGHKGKTLYVSKQGDNSDGSSWAKAFRTIQAGLQAVPDAQGGHRVIVRPDTYSEALVYPSRQGAAGAYNLLVGDCDGRLGSGATGWVAIDASCPGVAVRLNKKQTMFEIVKSDLPESGFKSVDWWTPLGPPPGSHAYPGVTWDRWILRNIYTTGGDAGLFWDYGDTKGFTVIAEDCVGIGRAFGGGFAYPAVRPQEPIVLRRCYLASLDWWGDAGGLAVGASNTSPPQHPDAICEDCTFVGPDNAVQILFPSKYLRLKMKDCRLIVLNFSQPRGTPSTGIIASIVKDPKQAHIDFEDCSLMGYKVFGNSNNPSDPGRISYTTKGKVAAYVQYEQSLPAGFQRLGLWPTDLFRSIAPRLPHEGSAAKGRPTN